MQVRISIASLAGAVGSLRDRTLLASGIGLLLLMGLIYGMLHRMVSRPVRRVLDVAGRMRQGDLTASLDVTGIDEVSHMSARINLVNRSLRHMIEDVNAASRNLSAVASVQAESIEETSASLEQMNAMTRQNAEDSERADRIMREANRAVGQADRSMQALVKSMETVSGVSEETGKILKTIDEIAFQTNMLALNAAVEAARAGEAGAGFAVVADEVRNLALRAAQAAGETSDLLETIKSHIGEGSAKVTETQGAFAAVAESAVKAGELVGRINDASSEQAQGIAQIAAAMAEMEGTTQKNVAGADGLVKTVSAFKIDTGPEPGNEPVPALPRPDRLAPVEAAR